MNAKASNPQISLVIPVRNEEASIDDLLRTIAGQTLKPDEIIFVDGGSEDRTVELILKATAQDHARVIEAGPSSPGRGRNIGIAAASHEWIALTDAGIRLDSRWLEQLVMVIRHEPDTDVVYGNLEPVVETFFEQNAAIVYVPPPQIRAGARMRGPFIPSCLLRREVWQSVGGFPDQRAAEDLIFMERVERQGCKIGWAPRATVWWRLRPTLVSTFRRFVLYSKHNVLAGRQRFWHYGIARQYGFALIFIALAIVTGHWWWLIALPAGLLARGVKTFWRQRDAKVFRSMFNPARVAHVLLIILAIDLATFVGWAQSYWEGNPALVMKAPAGKRDS